MANFMPDELAKIGIRMTRWRRLTSTRPSRPAQGFPVRGDTAGFQSSVPPSPFGGQNGLAIVRGVPQLVRPAAEARDAARSAQRDGASHLWNIDRVFRQAAES